MNFSQGVQLTEGVFIEDFEDGDLPQFDPLFNHSFEPLEGLDSTFWEISGPWGSLEDSGYFLGLWPAKDTITFNLQPGQAVYGVSVDIMNFADSSSVRFIGSEGEFTYSEEPFTLEWITFTTENLDIGEIRAIELFSNEALYDNIAIYVEPQFEAIPSATVPEPNLILALGISALGFGMVRVKDALQHRLAKL